MRGFTSVALVGGLPPHGDEEEILDGIGRGSWGSDCEG